MNAGAEDLMRDFLGCIDNENRTSYNWNMFDGFEIRSNVIARKEVTVEIDELPNVNGNKSTITHLHQFIGRNDHYVSTAANATHSVDSGVVREMHRRMKYDPKKLAKVKSLVEGARITETTKVPTLRMADWLLEGRTDFTESQAGQLNQLIEQVTQFKPAPLATIHDEFKTYPSACGQMRYHYRELFAEIAESELATQMLRGMYNDPTLVYTKHSDGKELAALIRKSRYAIC